MKTFKEGRLLTTIEDVARNNNIDAALLIGLLLDKLPELAKKDRCPNCDASMEVNVYTLDILNALLVYNMARKVREKILDGVDFTVANQVHIPSLPVSYSIQSRQTQCGKLGLIAKVKNAHGSHAKGVWAITTRGWALLRGDEVPSKVSVFRNQIVDHPIDRTTLQQAFRLHREKVEKMHLRHKDPRYDYRKETEEYSARDWSEYGGVAEGTLL